MSRKAGVYYDMSEEEYHGDPCPEISLSNSGLKTLCPMYPFNGSPAKFKYLQDHPEPRKQAWDFGKVAHAVLLGKGAEFVEVKFDTYRSDAAKKVRDEAYEAGLVPIKPAEMAVVNAMVEAALSNPDIKSIFSQGKAEVSMFWEAHGVWNRCRTDWITDSGVILADYKTTKDASDDGCQKAMGGYGYWTQAAQNCEGAIATGLTDDPKFALVYQEKTPPYLANIKMVSPATLEWGSFFLKSTRLLLRQCLDSGEWPGHYRGRVDTMELPHYMMTTMEALYSDEFWKE